MRLASLALLLVGSALAQVTVTCKPISTVTTRKVLGGGKVAGLWTVTACNDAAIKLSIDRARLLSIAPDLHDLPNDLAEDVLGRQTADNAKSFIGTQGDTLLGFTGQGLSIGGFATGTNTATYAGLGLTGLQFLFRYIGSRAPNAQPYFSRLLPDAMIIPAGACTPAFYLVASLKKGAATISGTVHVPVQ